MVRDLVSERRWRVLNDLSGEFERVACEVDLESLTGWDQARSMRFGLPAFQESMAWVQDLIASGQNEFWTVEAEGLPAITLAEWKHWQWSISLPRFRSVKYVKSRMFPGLTQRYRGDMSSGNRFRS